MTEFTNDKIHSLSVFFLFCENVSVVYVVPLTFYNIVCKINFGILEDADEEAEENEEEEDMKKKRPKPKPKDCGDCIYTRYLVLLNEAYEAHSRSKF